MEMKEQRLEATRSGWSMLMKYWGGEVDWDEDYEMVE
jgi:hypothetical protein